MADQDRLAARVRDLVDGRSAVVALSGGADSAVLALAAVTSGVPVRALHVHHGQPASDILERGARAVAEALGLPLTVHRVIVSRTGSFETAAREARYEALLGALSVDEVLLVGHTADDQAETVLLRLARGAGPSGLAGMRSEAGRIVRPLLGWRRAEIRAIADDAELPYVDDPANLDLRHSRVVVREEVLPALERLQPGATAAMAEHARLAGRLDDHVDAQVAVALQGPRLSLAVYRSFDGFLRPRALRQVAIRAGRTPPGTDALARMHDVAMGRAASAQVDDGFEVVRVGAYLEILRSCQVPAEPSVLETGVAGWGTWHFEVRIRPGKPLAWPLHTSRAVVPATGELRVRALRPEDARGGRRLMDELAGFPAHVRRCWPAVEFEGDLVWVPGVRRLDAGSIAADDDSYRWLIADRRDQWTSERS